MVEHILHGTKIIIIKTLVIINNDYHYRDVDLCLSVKKLRRLPSVPNNAVIRVRGPERKYLTLENRRGETSSNPHFS